MRLFPLGFFAFALSLPLASCTANVSPSTSDGPPILDDGIPDAPADETPKPTPEDPQDPQDPGTPVDPDGPPAPEKCGNGLKDPGESCDGNDLASTTCSMLGFDGGTLACHGDCSGFDARNCNAPPAPPIAAPSPIAVPGASIAFAGSIDLTDPSWTRPAQDCTSGSEGGRRFDVHRVVNNTGAPQALTVLAAFSGDGYLHAYTGTFDADAPTVGCIGGDDDGAGGTSQSEIVALPISAGEIVTIVVSTYAADAALGAYSLTVTTIGDDDAPVTAVCGDGLVDGAELCDGAALAGATCGDQGFNRGELACAAGCAALDASACWSIASPLSIAARGSSVSLTGNLAMSDAKWIRPTESCAAGSATSADRFFDAAQIVNNTGQAQTLDLTAAFAGDGFLHVFGAGFDPRAPTSPASACIRGDDDFNGSGASQLTGISIAAGQTLVVVASTYTANVALGAWSVEVRTTQPAVCGNNVIEGGEACDGAAFGGQTCLGRGFEGGALSCSATCAAVVESNCWDLPAATPIAAPGASIAFDGALDASDPRIDRVSESCSGSGPADHPWDGFRIVNNASGARAVTITATWNGGDGFLHVYDAASFDPASPLSGCVRGDDDFGAGGSQLAGIPIAAGQTLVVVASTFAANGTVGAYDIEVETDAAPGTPIAAKGLTMQLAGSLDATDASYERLSESCAPTGAQRKFDAFRIQNNTGAAQKLTVHGNWSGDGFLHVMGSTFDPANPGQSCRRGDDDFGTNASRLAGVDIAAGETIVVVASTFSSSAVLGAYTIDVLTEGDAAIASPGASISTKGALHVSDPLWNRPSESCGDDGGTAANFHDVHLVTNTSTSDRTIDVLATWVGGDGFLAVYFGDFTPAVAASDQCIDADDDHLGTTSSRVDAVTIFAGETLSIVASSFMASTPIASYTLDVRTR